MQIISTLFVIIFFVVIALTFFVITWSILGEKTTFGLLGLVMFGAILSGSYFFLEKLNTPEFPWGVLAFNLLFVLPGFIWIISIILDKKLTKKEKWNKLTTGSCYG